jgi:hypothetical protein
MLDRSFKPPDRLPLGKAKALEQLILADGTSIPKKTKVRFWIERRGAAETFCIFHKEKSYRLTTFEFKRRFKVIIKGGVHQLPARE